MADATILKLDNFTPNNVLEQSFLEEDADAGAVTMQLKSPQAFEQNLIMLIGSAAQENTELRQVASISGNVVTITALARKHRKFDNVTLLAGDQLQVWRGTAPTDGSKPAYSAMAKYGDPFPIDYDNLTTRYQDNDGGSGYWYGYTIVNSITAAESQITDSELVRGGSVADYCTINEIREEAGLENNPFISDVYIASKREFAEGIINDALKGHYTVPFSEPVPPTVRQMAILLAAGYVLKREYGSQYAGATANGNAKIKEVMSKDPKNPGLLMQILDGTIDLGGSTPSAGGSERKRVRGWPNSSTERARTEDGGARRKFRAGMKF